MPPLSDEALLAAYRNADPRGFDEFFRRRHRLIFGYLLAKLRSRADAEDALQETFLRIHRSILSYDPGQRALPWVFAIARNVLIDTATRQRRAAAEPVLAEPPDGRLTPEALLAVQQEVKALLAALTPGERELLVGRFLDDDPFSALAARQGVRVDAAKQRFSRLLKKIRTGS